LTAILPRLAELGSPVVGIAKQNQQKQLGPIRKMLKKIIYMPVNGSKLFDAIVDIIGIETDLESQEPVAKVKSAPGQGGKLKIDNVRALVAEDNAVNQQLITIMLKEIGIESEIAENGLVAMEKYCNGKYDIVLMDINMPECNGIEATRKIVQYEKENNINHIPIVALTAYAMKGDREKMISLGVDDYLSKPINKGELDTVLTRYLVK